MSLKKTRGIVLRCIKYKDGVVIVDLFTSDFGRHSYLVRVGTGKRSPVRRVLFQPLSLLEVSFEDKPNQSLPYLKESASSYPFASLPYHPYKQAIALFLSEFLYKVAREEYPNPSLFNYMWESFIWLDRVEHGFANYHLAFLIHLTSYLGIAPNMEGYRDGLYFDYQLGEFSLYQPLHRFFLNPSEARMLLDLLRMNYVNMDRFRMSRDERVRCLDIIYDYYRIHIADFGELKSIDVLKELFNN